MNIENFADIVESNGKTIRENNLERDHEFPIDTLVEAKYSEWFGNGACHRVQARLFVIEHTRDCDGTPLYTLARNNTQDIKDSGLGSGSGYDGRALMFERMFGPVRNIGEDSLTPCDQSAAAMRGAGALGWDDDE